MMPTAFDRLSALVRRLIDYGNEYVAKGMLSRGLYWLQHAMKLNRMVTRAVFDGRL